MSCRSIEFNLIYCKSFLLMGLDKIMSSAPRLMEIITSYKIGQKMMLRAFPSLDTIHAFMLHIIVSLEKLLLHVK